MGNAEYRLVRKYVGRSYVSAFLVAFCFFFFIFFVNQILLIVQHILIKNVSLHSVLLLVTLAIPQFLLYTFPFSSLTASAMVVGDLSANNEILALRSSGISLRHLFLPILGFSLLTGCLTFITADRILPQSHLAYRKLYTDLMRDLPTLELTGYQANMVGDLVMVNGPIEDDRVEDLVLFSLADPQDGRIISSPSAFVSMTDPLRFVYRLSLDRPSLLQGTGEAGWTLAEARRATLFLDFSRQVPEAATTNPSQLPIAELDRRIREKRQDLDETRRTQDRRIREAYDRLGAMAGEEDVEVQAYNTAMAEAASLSGEEPIGFYLQYYRAEKYKKLALSAACFLLVLLTFPLAYLRVKHGRLIGFGVAMLGSVAYWYLLFFAQISIYRTPVNPLFLMWGPDVLLTLVALVVLRKVMR